MAEIEVRAARPEDREAVLAFCVSTWEWGDYIEYVWDEWLHEPNGLLLVATLDGKPVGVANIRMLNEAEAWMEGMRVDPAYRQHGIATVLFNAQIAEAKRRGATNARLITESSNTASIRLIERSAMHRVGVFAPYRATLLTELPRRLSGMDMPRLATVSDVDEIIDYLNVSNIFPVVGGLYYSGFTAYTITSRLLETKIAAEQVYLLHRWDRLDGFALVEPREGQWGRQLFIGYIDGTTESISQIAYALRRNVVELGMESVQANVPDLMMVRDAFVGAEYEWDEKLFYTYEQELV